MDMNPSPAQPRSALLRDLYEMHGKVPLSFELFPPHSADGRNAMLETVERLAPMASRGFSVTMGAGGTTRSGTFDAATDAVTKSGRPVMAHLTALGLSRDEALETADRFWEGGIRRILALRGDRPRGVSGPLPPGFAHASNHWAQ